MFKSRELYLSINSTIQVITDSALGDLSRVDSSLVKSLLHVPLSTEHEQSDVTHKPRILSSSKPNSLTLLYWKCSELMPSWIHIIIVEDNLK